MILISTITCPRCGFTRPETMPTTTCQIVYDCPSVTSNCDRRWGTAACTAPMVVSPDLQGRSQQLRHPLTPRSEQKVSLNVSLCGLRDASELRYNCLVGDDDAYLTVGVQADGGKVLRADEGVLTIHQDQFRMHVERMAIAHLHAA